MNKLSMINRHLSPDLIKTTPGYTRVLQIFRPESKNAFNLKLLYTLIDILTSIHKHNVPVLLTGIPGKCFGSGGDLKQVTLTPLVIAEFLRSEHHLTNLTFLIKNSTSLWTNYVIGSGAGLACACKTRVAFPSTRYSMPENSIGLFPD